jgi:hypothetical protein
MNLDHIERAAALRRARKGAKVPSNDDRIDLDTVGACIAIAALLLCGLPICALIFAGGGQ